LLARRGEQVIAPLDFAPHEDVVFDNPPLMAVVCQVKFSPILSLMSEAGVAGFHEAVRRTYPAMNRHDSASIAVQGQSMGVTKQPPVWQFREEPNDKRWVVGLAVDSVSIETDSYTDFDEFVGRFAVVLAALQQTLRPSATTRVGLRKINELSHPAVERPSDWARFVRPEVLGILTERNLPAPIAGAFAEVRFDDAGENVLAVRHGLDPDPDKRLQYFLDLDYFTERPFDVDPENGICDLLRHFSNGITNLFHWVVGEDLKLSYSPHPRASKN
jgi:uncharacterized protein (TIGR04255 family)